MHRDERKAFCYQLKLIQRAFIESPEELATICAILCGALLNPGPFTRGDDLRAVVTHTLNEVAQLAIRFKIARDKVRVPSMNVVKATCLYPQNYDDGAQAKAVGGVTALFFQVADDGVDPFRQLAMQNDDETVSQIFKSTRLLGLHNSETVADFMAAPVVPPPPPPQHPSTPVRRRDAHRRIRFSPYPRPTSSQTTSTVSDDTISLYEEDEEEEERGVILPTVVLD